MDPVKIPHKHMMRIKGRQYFNNMYWHKFVCDKCKDYRLVEVGWFQQSHL